MITPCTYKTHVENTLIEVNSERGLATHIKKRHSIFFSHVMTRVKLEYVMTTGREEGQKETKEKMLDSLAL